MQCAKKDCQPRSTDGAVLFFLFLRDVSLPHPPHSLLVLCEQKTPAHIQQRCERMNQLYATALPLQRWSLSKAHSQLHTACMDQSYLSLSEIFRSHRSSSPSTPRTSQKQGCTTTDFSHCAARPPAPLNNLQRATGIYSKLRPIPNSGCEPVGTTLEGSVGSFYAINATSCLKSNKSCRVSAIVQSSNK